MINIQHASVENSNTNTGFSHPETNPEKTYFQLIDKLTPMERRIFCERIVRIHNLNSTPEFHLKIDVSTSENDSHIKFNNWITRVFHDLTTIDIAKIALLFDVFEEYTNNIDQTLECIKIKVMKQVFLKNGNHIAIELLRVNLDKLLFHYDYSITDRIKPMLNETADIEDLTIDSEITVDSEITANYKHNHIEIIHLLIEELTDIDTLLFALGITENFPYINEDINRLKKIDQIMKTTNNNYIHISEAIGDFQSNILLQQKICNFI